MRHPVATSVPATGSWPPSTRNAPGSGITTPKPKPRQPRLGSERRPPRARNHPRNDAKGRRNQHLALSLSKGGPSAPSVLRQAQHGVGGSTGKDRSVAAQ